MLIAIHPGRKGGNSSVPAIFPQGFAKAALENAFPQGTCLEQPSHIEDPR